MSSPTTFDVCGPLPSGVTLLEASAGTGKTFTIAALAARYVAEGTPLEHLLLVTFGRMATGELRERVRERLVTAERGLARVLDGATPAARRRASSLSSPAADGSEVAARRRRLAAALADFDAATIATTHGFCQHVLTSLGVAADVDADATFVEDPTDLVEEVVDDLYVRKFRRYSPPFGLDEALRIGKTAVFNPGAVLVPVNVDPATEPAMRRRLAVAVIEEFERRKRRLKVLTYDDLLTRLADTLRDPSAGRQPKPLFASATASPSSTSSRTPTRPSGRSCARRSATGTRRSCSSAIRSRRSTPSVAPTCTPTSTPPNSATTQATLGINWRSDQALIDAYDALMGGAAARPRRHRVPHRARRRRPPAATTDRRAGARRVARARAPPRRRAGPADAATEVGRASTRRAGSSPPTWPATSSPCCRPDAEIVVHRSEESDGRLEAVRPGHIAVLVSRNRDAATVRDALDAVGVPAVINGAGSVFLTPVARDWRALLEALERPSSTTRVHALALSVFVGWSAERVATADDAEWEDVYDRVHRWAELLRRRGVAALLESITHSEGLPGARARPSRRRAHAHRSAPHRPAAPRRGGGRWARRHRPGVVAAPHGSPRPPGRRRRGPQPAAGVRQRGGAGADHPPQQGPRVPDRLLPVPVERGWIDRQAIRPCSTTRRTATGDDRRRWQGRSRLREPTGQRYVEEERGEELRLAYVALTRARHQAVVWWATSFGSRDSALGRLLFAPDGSVLADAAERGAGGRPRRRARRPGARDASPSSAARAGPASRWSPAAARRCGTRRADVRPHARQLVAAACRTPASPPGLHEADVASEPEETGITDEQLPTAPAVEAANGSAAEPALRSVQLPLAAMPGGARVGSLVHAVLERVDFAAPDLAATSPRRSPSGWRGAGSTSVPSTPSSPGSWRRSRRRSVRSPVTHACATSAEPTASTSSASSCPSSAATRRRPTSR